MLHLSPTPLSPSKWPDQTYPTDQQPPQLMVRRQVITGKLLLIMARVARRKFSLFKS